MFQPVNRNRFFPAVLFVLLLLSACSTSPSPTNTTPPSTEETRVIQTSMGAVEVPTNPQRVIVDYLIGDVTALGVTPAGVCKSEYTGGKTAFQDSISGVPSVGDWDLDPESVMALEPDLILLSFSEEPYEDLSKIAPTVFVPYGSMTTEERITFLGEVLNRQTEAKQALQNYNNKLEQNQKRLQAAGLQNASVTILQTDGSNAWIAGSKHAVGVVAYKELNLAVPEKVQTDIINADEYWGNPSMEVLTQYCGEYMIHLGDLPASLSSNTIWNLIPAIQNKRIFSIDGSLTWYTDILSAGAVSDLITDTLIKIKSAE